MALVAGSAAAQQPDSAAKESKPEVPPAPAAQTPAENTRRIELNLLGKTDAAAGESRRNENIQFNLVDNNALKELNIRLGATATIIEVFRPERGYFSSEFGNPPGALLYVAPTNRGRSTALFRVAPEQRFQRAIVLPGGRPRAGAR